LGSAAGIGALAPGDVELLQIVHTRMPPSGGALGVSVEEAGGDGADRAHDGGCVDTGLCAARVPLRRSTTECQQRTRRWRVPAALVWWAEMRGHQDRYFPKGTDLCAITPEELTRVADEINERPRKTLAWARPAGLLADQTAAETA